MHKHLIFLIDGTWLAAQQVRANSFHSNIHKLNLELRPSDKEGNPQIIFYTRGIGSTGKINKYIGGGFAKGIDDIISDLYITLCSNYEPNDKVYIFGFSRGAVVARALVSMIARFGLLHADSINLYEMVWASFVHEAKISTLDAIQRNSKKEVIIEFLGLFDCVFGGGGCGPNKFHELRFKDLNVENCVKHVVHLLAIDESRRSFASLPIEKVLKFRAEPFETKLEQIWIPGVHSDIGGAYERRFLGDVALLSMIDRVTESTGLCFYNNRIDRRYEFMIDLFVNGHIHVNNELRGIWRFLRKQARVHSTRVENQQLHPIANFINQRLVYYKDKEIAAKYSLPSDFQGMKIFQGFHKYRFDESSFFYLNESSSSEEHQ